MFLLVARLSHANPAVVIAAIKAIFPPGNEPSNFMQFQLAACLVAGDPQMYGAHREFRGQKMSVCKKQRFFSAGAACQVLRLLAKKLNPPLVTLLSSESEAHSIFS